jgi:plasmid replication initiation protein
MTRQKTREAGKLVPSKTTRVEEQEVKKATEAIAIRPRAGRMTLLTRKLFNVLLKLAQEEGEDQAVYRMPLSDITSNATFDSNDTMLIKDHLRKMNQIQVEWSTSGQEGRRWGVTNMIAEAEIIEDAKSRRTWVEWSFAPKIKRRLLDPETYARLSLQSMSALRSGTSYALYEICFRYATSPAGLTMRQRWEWWRPVLTGTPDSESRGGTYSEYKYLKRDVLKPAVAEINAVTDIQVELIEHKNGRRVEEIQFRVKKKEQSRLPLQDNNLIDMGLVTRMQALGLSQRDVEHVYGEHEETFIRATLDYVESRLKNRKLPAVENVPAYFKDALRKRYAPPVEPQALDKPGAGAKPKISRERVLEAYRSSQRDKARDMFREMQAEGRESALSNYESERLAGAPPHLKREFSRKGLESKAVEVDFMGWLAGATWGEPTESDLLEFMLEQAGELK